MAHSKTPRFHRASALGLAAVTLVTVAEAQLQQVYDPSNIVPPPAGTTLPTSYTEATAGDLFTNFERAVAGVDGGVLRYNFDPRAIKVNGEIDSAGGYVGMTSLPQTAGLGNPILATNGSGLQRLDPDLENGGFLPPVQLLGSPWAGAKMLHMASMAGQRHLVGVSSTGLEVLIAKDAGTGWVHVSSIPLPKQALDIAVLDMFGEPNEGVCTIDDDFLRVYDATGAVRLILPSRGGSTASVCRVRTSDGEHIAWLTRSAAGAPWLRIVRDDGAEVPITLSLPIDPGGANQDLDPARVEAGDVNGDGEEDCIVTDFASHRAVYFVNQGNPTAHFSAAALGTDHALLRYGASASAPAPNNVCPPVVADFDGDTIPDIAVYDNESGEMSAWITSVAPGLGGGIAVGPGGVYDFVAAETSLYYDWNNGQPSNQMNLAFTFEPWQVDPATGMTGIETVVWRYSPNQDGVAKSVQKFSVLSGETNQYVRIDLDPLQPPTSTAHPFWDDEDLFLVRYRWMNEDANGNPVYIGHSHLAAMSVDDDLGNFAETVLSTFNGVIDLPPPQGNGNAFKFTGATQPQLADTGGGSTVALGAWVSDIDPPSFLQSPSISDSTSGGPAQTW